MPETNLLKFLVFKKYLCDLSLETFISIENDVAVFRIEKVIENFNSESSSDSESVENLLVPSHNLAAGDSCSFYEELWN